MSSKVIPPRKKIYAIMQVPPPIHGSAKVSQFIKDNLFINKKTGYSVFPNKGC